MNKKLKKSISLAVLASVLILSVQCASVMSIRKNTSKDIDIKKLALMVNDSLRKPSLKNQEIGLLSLTNLNNLDMVDPLGRLIQERLSHELFDLGFRIVEIRLAEHITFEPQIGEINLTRVKDKLKEKDEFKEIKSLIVGTYIDSGDYVYVNVKLVELENNLVRGSGEIHIKKGDYLLKLLNEEDMNPKKRDVYERFPETKDNPK